MAKIDIDRFICSLIKLNGFAGMYNLSNTRKALELQGLKYDSETDEIVMVASTGEVSFYDKEGMVNIIHLSELENEEHCFVTGSED